MIRSILAANLVYTAFASMGPQALYQALSPLTLTLVSPGSDNTYEIKPYNEFKAITSNGNITFGYFSDYIAFDNAYNYHLYVNGTADADCTSGRLIDVSILCGQTHMIPAVIESPECEYHSILYSPWACGIDFTVGNENASASATPSPTRTPSGTGTGTPSAIAFATVFPSASQTATSTPSSSPLFMITAYPTTSPVNVSPTSSPLFYLTPYASYDPNANVTAAVVVAPSQGGMASTIMGAVAVGGVALGAIGFIIRHFKNGGTVGGLFKIAMANKDKIQSTIGQIPGANAALNKVMNDPNAKKLLTMAQNPNGAIDSLQIPDALKQSMKSAFPTSQEELLKLMQDPNALRSKLTGAIPTNIALPPEYLALMRDTKSVSESMTQKLPELQQLAASVGMDKNQTFDLSKYAKMAFEAKPTDGATGLDQMKQMLDADTLKKLVATMAAEKTSILSEQLPVSKEALQAVLTPVLGAAAPNPTAVAAPAPAPVTPPQVKIQEMPI
jgi:hypothetical protein